MLFWPIALEFFSMLPHNPAYVSPIRLSAMVVQPAVDRLFLPPPPCSKGQHPKDG